MSVTSEINSRPGNAFKTLHCALELTPFLGLTLLGELSKSDSRRHGLEQCSSDDNDNGSNELVNTQAPRTKINPEGNMSHTFPSHQTE